MTILGALVCGFITIPRSYESVYTTNMYGNNARASRKLLHNLNLSSGEVLDAPLLTFEFSSYAQASDT